MLIDLNTRKASLAFLCVEDYWGTLFIYLFIYENEKQS